MNLIHFLQSFQTDGLTFFFKLITLLGNKEFYILGLPLFFWLWDKEKAIRLLYILLPSALINFYLKELFQTSRPLGVALIEQGGFSFPSGHAQGAATLWLMLALMIRQKWMAVLAFVMIFLISLSRLYLGVHFAVDVIGGSLIGLVLVLIYHYFLFDFPKRVFVETSAPVKGVAATVIILLCAWLYPAGAAITILAVLWGFAIMLLFSKVIYCTPLLSIWQALLAVGVGIAGVLLIWKGLKIILPPTEMMRFLRYAFIGIWAAALPLLFESQKGARR